jgi:hypothetical protein
MSSSNIRQLHITLYNKLQYIKTSINLKICTCCALWIYVLKQGTKNSKRVSMGPVPYAGTVGNWRKNDIRRNTPTSTMADRSINIDNCN